MISPPNHRHSHVTHKAEPTQALGLPFHSDKLPSIKKAPSAPPNAPSSPSVELHPHPPRGHTLLQVPFLLEWSHIAIYIEEERVPSVVVRHRAACSFPSPLSSTSNLSLTFSLPPSPSPPSPRFFSRKREHPAAARGKLGARTPTNNATMNTLALFPKG